MQKPKNLLPGLFLCVFSRIAEPLVDFYCSNLLAFPLFLFGADFFAGKKGVYGPFYIGPFCAPHRLSTRFYFAQSAPTKGPLTKNPGTRSAPERAFGNTHPKGPPRTPRLYSAALFGTHRPHERAPMQKPGEGAGAPQKFPNAKNPGSKSRGLVDEKFI